MADAGAIAFDQDAAPTRRRLGPRAWFVFEELLLRADAQQSCSLGAREIARALGMSKDTAARALAELIDAGLVERVVSRSAGRFAGARLVIRLPAGVRRIAASDETGHGSSRRRSTAPAKPRRPGPASQLSLMGGDGG